MKKTDVPHQNCIDETFALTREGYLFIKNRAEKLHSFLMNFIGV